MSCFKRYFSVFLALLLCMSMMPINTLAVELENKPAADETIDSTEAPVEEATEVPVDSTEVSTDDPIKIPVEEPPEDPPGEDVSEVSQDAGDVLPAEPVEIPVDEPIQTPVTEFPMAATSGVCGESLTWEINEEGSLFINGTGAMYSYNETTKAPWYDQAETIHDVVISVGATSIGNNAFLNCSGLQYIVIPSSISFIGNDAFVGCGALTDVHYNGTQAQKDSIDMGNNSGFLLNAGWHLKSPEIGEIYGYANKIEFKLPRLEEYQQYEIYCGTSEDSMEPIEIAEISPINDEFTSYWVGPLSYGTYYFKLRLCEGELQNEFSSTRRYKHIELLPPQNLTVEIVNDGFNVSWEPVEGATQYDLWLHGDFRDFETHEIVTSNRYFRPNREEWGTTETTHKITFNDERFLLNKFELINGNTYTFEVKAIKVHSDNDWGMPNNSQSEGVYQKVTMPAETGVVASGDCGENLQWSYTADGTLTISGTGDMDDFGSPYNGEDGKVDVYETPWGQYQAAVQKLVINEGVTSIGTDAFTESEKLTTVSLPRSMNLIRESAFWNCNVLSHIGYPGTKEDWNNMTIEDDNDPLLVVYLGQNTDRCGDNATWSLENGTLTISGTGDMYYYHEDGAPAPWYTQRSSITKVVVEDGITSIGQQAFEYCWNLSEVLIPDSVTAIFSGAFMRCYGLESITIPESVSRFGNAVFSECGLLEEVVIPSQVDEIDEAMFAGCVNLRSVVIPAAVTEIDEGAFRGCEYLTDVYYGGTQEQKDAMAIGVHNEPLTQAAWHMDGSGDCGEGLIWSYSASNSTLTISGTGNMEDFGSPYNGGNGKIGIFKTPWGEHQEAIRNVVIEEGVTGIGTYAFTHCSSLKIVTLPKSLQQIGRSAFWNCNKLNMVDYAGTEDDWNTMTIEQRNDPLMVVYLGPDTNRCGDDATWSLENGTLTISGTGNMYFYHWASAKVPWYDHANEITGVVIKNGITSIGQQVFMDCVNLTDVSIAGSVTDLDNGAFENCTSLTNITIPESVSWMGNGVFMDCASLDDVVIPYQVDYLGKGAFEDCTSLTNITIPVAVEEIDKSAFSGCTNLATVYYDGTQAQKEEILVGENNEPLLNAEWVFTPYQIRTPEIKLINGMDEYIELVLPTPESADLQYEIFCGISEDNMEQAIITEVSNLENGRTSYSIAPLEEGTYYFKVRLCDEQTDYGFSRTRKFDYVLLPAPQNFTVEVTEDCFNVSWDPVENATEYRLFMRGEFFDTEVGEFQKDIALQFKPEPDRWDATGTTYTITFDDVRLMLDQYQLIGNNEYWFNVWAEKVYNDVDANIVEKCNTSPSAYQNVVMPTSTVASGTCGAGLTWTYQNDGTLTITGTGEMDNYDSPYSGTDGSFESFKAPWGKYQEVIKNVVIEEGVTSVGVNAFVECVRLQTVTFPITMSTIGEYAFWDCKFLASINYAGTDEEWNAINIEPYNDTLIIIRLGSNTDRCGENATWSLDANGTLTISGTGAMYDYHEGTKAPWYGQAETIKKVVIEGGVTSIGQWTFVDCINLTEISIPDSVTAIGNCVFMNCTSLADITIPETVEWLGNSVFVSCTSLETVAIPEGVQRIGLSFFIDCKNLKSVTIPSSVTLIKKWAFFGCDSLTDVYFNGTEEEWNNIEIKPNNDPLTGATIHYAGDAGDSIDIDISNGTSTTSPAEITPPEGGWKEGTNTFTVSCETACYVAVSYDGGATYTRLPATAVAAGEAYSFTAENMDANTMIAVGSVGDVNGDGRIRATDARIALQASSGNVSISSLQLLSVDLNCDGKILAREARMLLQASSEMYNLTW